MFKYIILDSIWITLFSKSSFYILTLSISNKSSYVAVVIIFICLLQPFLIFFIVNAFNLARFEGRFVFAFLFFLFWLRLRLLFRDDYLLINSRNLFVFKNYLFGIFGWHRENSWPLKLSFFQLLFNTVGLLLRKVHLFWIFIPIFITFLLTL